MEQPHHQQAHKRVGVAPCGHIDDQRVERESRGVPAGTLRCDTTLPQNAVEKHRHAEVGCDEHKLAERLVRSNVRYEKPGAAVAARHTSSAHTIVSVAHACTTQRYGAGSDVQKWRVAVRGARIRGLARYDECCRVGEYRVVHVRVLHGH